VNSGLTASLATRLPILLILLWLPARGDTLTLPLSGYFHPGRAMPVQWDGSSSGIIQLSASGAITSRVQTAGARRGIFPWLVFDQNAVVTRADFPPLHPLDDSDRLVASTFDDDSFAAALFPNRRLVLLHPPNVLQGPPMAWETLDAVLLTPEALATIAISARADLFAAGVELAVIGDAEPDAILPWRRSGKWWIASSDFRRPQIFDADAYAPTYGWNAGRTVEFRRHIFLLGVVYCLIVSGIALWHWRWMPVAIVALSICTSLFFASDNRKYSPVFRRTGLVHLIDDATFTDQWVYQVSRRDFEMKMLIEGSIHPIFSEASQPAAMHLTIDCDDHGEPISISGRLLADQPLALMTRRLTVSRGGIHPVNPPDSPMRLLASDPVYRGFRLLGELDNLTSADSWPAIVLLATRP
jgi:hypothetical protein